MSKSIALLLVLVLSGCSLPPVDYGEQDTPSSDTPSFYDVEGGVVTIKCGLRLKVSKCRPFLTPRFN